LTICSVTPYFLVSSRHSQTSQSQYLTQSIDIVQLHFQTHNFTSVSNKLSSTKFYTLCRLPYTLSTLHFCFSFWHFMISQSSADRCSQSVAVTVNTRSTQLLRILYSFSQRAHIDLLVLNRCRN